MWLHAAVLPTKMALVALASQKALSLEEESGLIKSEGPRPMLYCTTKAMYIITWKTLLLQFYTITQLIQIMNNYLNQCAIMLEIVYVLYYRILSSGTRDLIFFAPALRAASIRRWPPLPPVHLRIPVLVLTFLEGKVSTLYGIVRVKGD